MRNSAISLLQIKELFSPFFIVTSSDECRVSVTLINSSLIPGQEAQSGSFELENITLKQRRGALKSESNVESSWWTRCRFVFA